MVDVFYPVVDNPIRCVSGVLATMAEAESLSHKTPSK